MAKLDTLKISDWQTQSAFTIPTDGTVSAGNLSLPASGAYPTAATTAAWDLVGSHFAVDVPQSPNPTAAVEMYIGVRLAPYANADEALFFWNGGNLFPAYRVGGVWNEGPWNSYSLANHRYFQIREAAGTLHWEASGDGQAWVELWSRPAPFSMTAVYPYFEAGNWNSVASPGAMVIGEVNTFTGGPTVLSPSVLHTKRSDGSWLEVTIKILPVSAQTTTIPIYPTVRSSTFKSQSSSTGGATAKTHPAPRGIQVGDLLILVIVQDYGNISAMTPPTGFGANSINGVTSEMAASGTNTVRLGVYVKTAVQADTTQVNYTFGMTSDSDAASMMITVKDWDKTTTNLSFALAQTTKAALAMPTVTPKKAGLAMFFCAHDNSATGGVYDWVAPEGTEFIGKATNATGWSSVAVASRIITSTAAISGVNWLPSRLTPSPTQVLGATLTIGANNLTATQLLGNYSGGSGGSPTDQTNLTFEDTTGRTSGYHLYAGGLDWTKNVGIIVYTDGSGEYGLADPTLNYLLAGPRGLIAVAKKHNMILLTPRAPGNGCTDNDGVCWYMNSFDGTTPEQKLEWSRQLIDYIWSRYNICKSRVVVSGYSSGAQWTTAWFGPAYAHEYMTDGLLLPISYGGQPRVPVNNTASFKENVPVLWNVGELDDSWRQPTWNDSVQRGLDYYSANGYTTAVNIVAGIGHDRYSTSPEIGHFGGVVDQAIQLCVHPT